LNRRNFITQSISAIGLLSHSEILHSFSEGYKLDHFGFISGIIGKEIKQDWKAALKQAADHGFTEIETGKYFGESAQSFLAYCRDIGIKPTAGGISISTQEADINKNLDALQELDIKIAVVYWPWLISAPFKLEDCQQSTVILNTLGEACKKRKMTLCWHNHDREFVAMEEGLPFDYLMKHTEKELVKCEMDVFWVAKGGADPLTYLKKYEGRYAVLHLKDMTNDDQKTFECVGKGSVDFKVILKEANKQGIKHYFVEFDKVVDGMACLQTSGEYLKNLTF
jgi:sugar phosphate isomerase/epimerase